MCLPRKRISVSSVVGWIEEKVSESHRLHCLIINSVHILFLSNEWMFRESIHFLRVQNYITYMCCINIKIKLKKKMLDKK